MSGSSGDKGKARLNDDPGDEQEMVLGPEKVSSQEANLHLPADLRRPATEFYREWKKRGKDRRTQQQSALDEKVIEFMRR